MMKAPHAQNLLSLDIKHIQNYGTQSLGMRTLFQDLAPVTTTYHRTSRAITDPLMSSSIQTTH